MYTFLTYCFVGLVFLQSHLCPLTLAEDNIIGVRNIEPANQSVVTTPKWNSRYHIQGIIHYHLPNLNETFEGWYDSGRSRIDYQNGKTQTYQFSQMTRFGTSYKVHHEDSIDGKEQKKETGRCSLVRGTGEFKIFPQDILPDLSNFKFDSIKDYGKIKAEFWVYQSEKGHIVTRHEMWLIKNNNNYHPLMYAKYLAKKKFPMLLDSFTIVYTSYNPLEVNSGSFNILSYLCEIEDEPRLDHVYRFNPMMELINNYKDNYYYYVEPIFEDFKSRYNKTYENNVSEYIRRKTVFHKNLRYIHWKNRATVGYTLSVNQFSDIYKKELKAMFAHEYYEKFEDRYRKNNEFHYNKTDFKYLPSEIDWLDIGAVTSVKDQSDFAFGWIHAISGTMEGAYFKKHGQLKNFSTQALIDCTLRRKINDSEFADSHLAYKFIEQEGLPTQEDYISHSSNDSNCHISNIPNNRLTKITGYLKLFSGNEDALKLALVKYGPIAISIHASLSSFMFYSDGVYYDEECDNSFTEELNHGALLVGYGTVNGRNYWLVKNSWSSQWGEEGYIRIARKRNNCGVRTSPTFVIL